MPLFGKSIKSPSEVVRSLKDCLIILEKGEGGKKAEKAVEDVSKLLLTISGLLFNCETEQQGDVILAQMSQEMYNSGLVPTILRNLARIEFEARKEATQIFKHVLKRQIGEDTNETIYAISIPQAPGPRLWSTSRPLTRSCQAWSGAIITRRSATTPGACSGESMPTCQ